MKHLFVINPVAGGKKHDPHKTESDILTAMEKIGALASEDPQTLLRTLFSDIQISGEEMVIDGVPYVGTSLAHEDLAGYYGDTFTGEALEWILSTKFAEVDGAVYCSLVGGQSGGGLELSGVEKVEENTWQGSYLTYGEEHTTLFQVEETAGGYRISAIDYRPAGLER